MEAVCPTCSARYPVEELIPGRRFRCGQCRTIFAVQESGDAAQPASSPPPAPDDRDLEGGAVPAKKDGPLESAVKFARRNRAVSVAAAFAGAVVIALTATGYALNLQERKKAEAALAEFKAERKQTASVIVQAARQAIASRNWNAAQDYLDAALATDPGLAEARFLKAGVRLAMQDLPGAVEEFQAYAAARPNDADAAELAETCRMRLADRMTPETATWIFSRICVRRKEFGPAGPHLRRVVYREILSKALPSWENDWLFVSARGDLELDLTKRGLQDLSFLKGMTLDALMLDDNPISDLSPLQGSPLAYLSLVRTAVRDLTPLSGMKLQELRFDPGTITKGLDLIRSMNTVEGFSTDESGRLAPREFWKRFDEKRLK